MDLNFCASAAIELMDNHHTTSLPKLLPLFITAALVPLMTAPSTIVDHSAGLDACVLSIKGTPACRPLRLTEARPREGKEWRSFAHPAAKTTIGHRLSGKVAHTLPAPRSKIEIDLSIDSTYRLQEYNGCSGAPVVSEGACCAMLRVRLDGTLGALSIRALRGFLRKNDIGPRAPRADRADIRRKLASRDDFQDSLEKRMLAKGGGYLFLEGAPGIGKTTFCRFFSPLDKRFLLLGAYCISQSPLGAGATYHAQPDVFCDWLSTTISGVLYGRPSRYEPKPYAALVVESGELLAAFAEHCTASKRHGLLFIDGVNEVEDLGPGALVQFAGVLPLQLPRNLSIILTAPNFAALAARLSGHIAPENVLSLPPLGEDACRLFCRHELIKSRRQEHLVHAICERAQGHPLYLQYLITYANSHPEDEALNDFPVLDGTIEHYYERIWTKLREDPRATNVLRILARTRGGLGRKEFLKVLTETERSAFTRTLARIQHLLAPPDYQEIYHFSFAAFVLTKTADLDEPTHQLLADFCSRERAEPYCQLNVVFHLLRSGDVGRHKGVKLCDQPWVDACVRLAAEPDVLLSDVKDALQAAIAAGNAVETIRLLLLRQRVTFRYDALFAQSAHLVAEALIELQRPKEALSHAIRFNTLIVDPEEAQSISFALIKHGYFDEALQVLRLLVDRCVEAYAVSGLPLDSFVEICRLHIRTLLLMRLADGNRRMEQVNRVFSFAQRALTASLKEGDRRLAKECMDRISALALAQRLGRAGMIAIAQPRAVVRRENDPRALFEAASLERVKNLAH